MNRDSPAHASTAQTIAKRLETITGGRTTVCFCLRSLAHCIQRFDELNRESMSTPNVRMHKCRHPDKNTYPRRRYRWDRMNVSELF